jgi:TM2 domain-containing membrane protein YozV
MTVVTCPSCGWNGRSNREVPEGAVLTCKQCSNSWRYSDSPFELVPKGSSRPESRTSFVAEDPSPANKPCAYCGEEILTSARKCKHCGEYLDAQLRAESRPAPPRERKWSPGVAAVISFFFPGVGHMYKGQIGTGMFWLIIVVAGYFAFILPGVILHLICIFAAASGDPYAEKGKKTNRHR